MTPKNVPVKRRETPRPATKTPRKGKRSATRPAPLTWADARWELFDGGVLFTMPETERVNAVWRRARNRTIVSQRHRDDKAMAPLVFARAIPVDGDVWVSMHWHRSRRDGDVDGRIKTALDLLQGIAYHDDAQVAALDVRRIDDDTQAARLEVLVRPLPTMWGSV